MSREGKKIFDDLLEILTVMKKYNTFGIDEEKTGLFTCFFNNKAIPLPSGDYGNVLALALQQNYYVIARHLIDNCVSYGLDFEKCAFSSDGQRVFSLQEEFLYSLEYFEDEKIVEDYMYDGEETILKEIKYYRQDPTSYFKRNQLLRNIQAKNDIARFLNPKTQNRG